MNLLDPWLLIAICLLIASVIAVVVIKRSARCAIARKRWQQRRAIRRLKRQLPEQCQQEKQRLCELWNDNPAAQCTTIFNRFERWPPSNANPEEVADEVERAITVAWSVFERDYTSRYADLYAKRLVVRTTEAAEQLAAQYPENAGLILQRVAENDAEISRRLEECIRDALSQADGDRELIRAHITQLKEDLPQLRRVLTPSLLSKMSPILVGAATGGILGALGLHSLFLTFKASQFTAGRWVAWKSKEDEEFADRFSKQLTQQLPTLCEDLNVKVRQSLAAAIDCYIQHKFKLEQGVLDVLDGLSHAKCDVESGICWFRNAFATDASSKLASWSGLFAGAGVLVFIAAASAVWLYSPHTTKAPATMPSPENKEATAVAAQSQLDTGGALAGTATSTSADQPSPAPSAMITSEPPNASGMLRPTEATIGQKKTAIEQRAHQAVHSDSPTEGKYPFARRAERPGFYHSPYTGRVYDLRRVAEGGVVRDPDTGQLFRRPSQNKESKR
jgi:hypothetical protein